MKKWIVFYAKNARIGSLPMTDQNLDGMKAQFCISLIQTDLTGTQHWHILSPWGKSSQGRMAQVRGSGTEGTAQGLKVPCTYTGARGLMVKQV